MSMTASESYELDLLQIEIYRLRSKTTYLKLVYKLDEIFGELSEFQDVESDVEPTQYYIDEMAKLGLIVE
jgi:hypothetical protein